MDGECRQIIEQANSGVFVEPENVTQMAEVLQTLFDQPEQIRVMGESGRKYVERFFDRDEMALKYLGILKEVIQHQ